MGFPEVKIESLPAVALNFNGIQRDWEGISMGYASGLPLTNQRGYASGLPLTNQVKHKCHTGPA